MTPEQKLRDAAHKYRDKVYEAERSLNLSPYELELKCLRYIPFGHPLKAEFCLGAMQMQWDFLYIEKDGVKNNWFTRIVRQGCKYNYINLLGTASAGKTFGAATVVYTLWKCSPWNTSVYLTTTTAESGEARTWGAVKDLYAKDKFKIGTPIPYKHTIVLEEVKNDKDRDYRDAIACVQIKPGQEGRNVLSSIVGRKNENVIWVCDELPFLDLGVLDARLNLESNPFFQFWGIGNKPNEGDPLYIDAEPLDSEFPDGWKTPDLQDRPLWKTRAGVCLYFDGEKSPNLKLENEGKPPPFPRLATKKFIENVARTSGGKDSPGYWTQVRGFPNMSDVQDRVLTSRILERFKSLEDPVWRGDGFDVVAGLDWGLKADGDPCVASFAKLGKDHTGKTILSYEKETVQLTPKVSSKGTYDEQVVDVFLEECEKRNCHAVAVDISGGGGLPTLTLRNKAQERGFRLEILSVDFGGKPDEDVFFDLGGSRKPATELFDRKVSQIWYGMRISVQEELLKGMNQHSKGVKQLCERRVIMDEKKRWRVETKKEMKERIKRSPDDGDAMALTHYLAKKRGLGSYPVEKKVTLSWAKPVEKVPYRGYSKKAAYNRR